MSTALSWRNARLPVHGKRIQALHAPHSCAVRGQPSTYRWSERSKPSHIVHAEAPTSPGAPASQPMTATAQSTFGDTTMTDTKDFLAKELVGLFNTGVGGGCCCIRSDCMQYDAAKLFWVMLIAMHRPAGDYQGEVFSKHQVPGSTEQVCPTCMMWCLARESIGPWPSLEPAWPLQLGVVTQPRALPQSI